MSDEPSEEAFQAAAKRLQKRKDGPTKNEDGKSGSAGGSKRSKV